MAMSRSYPYDHRASTEHKKRALLDAIRRVVANPFNAERVAEAIAEDWSPMMLVDQKGNVTFPSLERKDG
jgi:hypothetical protein